MSHNYVIIEYVEDFTNISTSAPAKSDCDKLIVREESRLLNAHAITIIERQRERKTEREGENIILSHRRHCYSKAGAFHKQDLKRTYWFIRSLKFSIGRVFVLIVRER